MAEALSRGDRLDAVEAALVKVVTGKAGSVKTGADFVVGKLAGSTRSAWWNMVWRLNPNNESSSRVDENLWNAAGGVGTMPLVVVKGTTRLVLTGEQVAEARELFRA